MHWIASLFSIDIIKICWHYSYKVIDETYNHLYCDLLIRSHTSCDFWFLCFNLALCGRSEQNVTYHLVLNTKTHQKSLHVCDLLIKSQYFFSQTGHCLACRTVLPLWMANQMLKLHISSFLCLKSTIIHVFLYLSLNLYKVFHLYVVHLSIYIWPCWQERERELYRPSPTSVWGLTVNSLIQLAAAEKSYTSLFFLGQKWFSVGRKDVSL